MNFHNFKNVDIDMDRTNQAVCSENSLVLKSRKVNFKDKSWLVQAMNLPLRLSKTSNFALIAFQQVGNCLLWS